MVDLERIYVVPLGDAYRKTRNKRTPRAVKLLKEFVARHMKARYNDSRIIISESLNKTLWARSIQNPPRKIRIKAIKTENTVTVYLPDEKTNIEVKKTKLEKETEKTKTVEKPKETKKEVKSESKQKETNVELKKSKSNDLDKSSTETKNSKETPKKRESIKKQTK